MNAYSPIVAQNTEDISEDTAMQLSIGECLILSLFGSILLATISISAWSGILLALGHTQGGGRLGMLFRLWQNFQI